MNVEVNPNGTIARYGRPYIDGEELDTWTLYDPNGPGIDYGLYSRVQKPCNAWLNHYWRNTQTGVERGYRGNYVNTNIGVGLDSGVRRRNVIRPINRY